MGEGIETIDRVPEGTGGSNVFPSERGKACYSVVSYCYQQLVASDGSPVTISGAKQNTAGVDVLQRGVIGVLTGLTRTLSLCNWEATIRC